VWRSYKAALAFAVREERRRCREIIVSFEHSAPENIRKEIEKIIKRLDAENIPIMESATA
jgi:hypothetical protein